MVEIRRVGIRLRLRDFEGGIEIWGGIGLFCALKEMVGFVGGEEGI
jgi:hypothetical protein